MPARAFDHLAIVIQKRVELLGERGDLQRIGSGEPLGPAAAHRCDVALQRAQRRKADAHLKRRHRRQDRHAHAHEHRKRNGHEIGRGAQSLARGERCDEQILPVDARYRRHAGGRAHRRVVGPGRQIEERDAAKAALCLRGGDQGALLRAGDRQRHVEQRARRIKPAHAPVVFDCSDLKISPGRGALITRIDEAFGKCEPALGVGAGIADQLIDDADELGIDELARQLPLEERKGRTADDDERKRRDRRHRDQPRPHRAAHEGEDETHTNCSLRPLSLREEGEGRGEGGAKTFTTSRRPLTLPSPPSQGERVAHT